ncbi:MAG: hypothetical protein ACYTGF_06330, partial [Planctomycetota bacterium]
MGGHCMPILIPALAAILAAPPVVTATVEDADSPFLELEETWAGTMLASRARYLTRHTDADVELGP